MDPNPYRYEKREIDNRRPGISQGFARAAACMGTLLIGIFTSWLYTFALERSAEPSLYVLNTGVGGVCGAAGGYLAQLLVVKRSQPIHVVLLYVALAALLPFCRSPSTPWGLPWSMPIPLLMTPTTIALGTALRRQTALRLRSE